MLRPITNLNFGQFDLLKDGARITCDSFPSQGEVAKFEAAVRHLLGINPAGGVCDRTFRGQPHGASFRELVNLNTIFVFFTEDRRLLGANIPNAPRVVPGGRVDKAIVISRSAIASGVEATAKALVRALAEFNGASAGQASQAVGDCTLGIA
jgi:hypothetical protein